MRRDQRAREDRRGGRPGESLSASRRTRSGDPARTAAWDTLREVSDSDAYANLVLPPMLSARGIHGRDAGFATELTYGTLRLRGRYDAIIAIAADRAVTTIDEPVLNVLRLGAHQVLSMRVPAHAAVSETVALARENVGAGPAQFVNAVLRRISERTPEEWREAVEAAAKTEDDFLAAWYSHPTWIVRGLRAALADTAAGADDLLALLDADNVGPAVSLVARPGLAEPRDLEAITAAGAAPSPYAPTAWTLAGGDPGALAPVRDGVVGVQDEGSQLVALALADAPLEGRDERWLDLCAGPGGKAALLGALVKERAGEAGWLLANEVAPHRADLVRSSVRALGQTVTVRTGDGLDVGEEHPGEFDRVLVDAPCTGLGALRRRPESRWRRTAKDLAELGSLQRDLLVSAARATRPGGLIAYVTCSPHLAETRLVVEDVVRALGKEGLDLDTVPAPPTLDELTREPVPALDGDHVQLWPHRHGTDAMFLALLRRR